MVDYKILAVDDDSDALEAVADLLRSEGYEVHAAADAEEAQELLYRDTYHLVITDLVMPGKNGIELTKVVRENLPRACVLVVSAHGTLESAVDALKAGASDFLQKPVDPRRLKALVAQLLAGLPRYIPNRLLGERDGPSRAAPIQTNLESSSELAGETLDLLSRYTFAGNLRELQSVLEQAVALCRSGTIGPEHLPRFQPPADEAGTIRIAIGTAMKEIERTVIARTLDANRWNKNRTAKILGISRRSLYNKLERYGIERASEAAPVAETLAPRAPVAAGSSTQKSRVQKRSAPPTFASP